MLLLNRVPHCWTVSHAENFVLIRCGSGLAEDSQNQGRVGDQNKWPLWFSITADFKKSFYA
jgi:hypothetical protein